jgi:hypothetical protein
MPETELAATLVRILTGPRTDVERRDMRRIGAVHQGHCETGIKGSLKMKLFRHSANPGAPAGHGSGPMWVKSRHRRMSERCPLCPRKRTLIERIGMSALCQKRT